MSHHPDGPPMEGHQIGGGSGEVIDCNGLPLELRPRFTLEGLKKRQREGHAKGCCRLGWHERVQIADTVSPGGSNDWLAALSLIGTLHMSGLYQCKRCGEISKRLR